MPVLAQAAPADTNNAVLLTVKNRIILHKLFIANTTGTNATCRVFIDDNGTTATAATALLYDKVVVLNTTEELDFDEATMSTPTGTITVSSGTNDALTFTLFGEEALS